MNDQTQNNQGTGQAGAQVPTIMNTQTAPMQTPSERFTTAVLSNFATNAGETQLTSFQKKLIQNYFLKIDMVLIEAEKKRMAKSEQYREKLAYVWQNVNLKKLAIDVISYSAVGLDPMQKNQLNPIPFKNGQMYDFSFILGYKGIEIKARKYGLDVPDHVVVEVIYKNDRFVPHKKDRNNPYDTYEYTIAENPFDRGAVVGGFYYLEYTENPSKCRLKVFSKDDIDKRKPAKASAEFWGGTKDVWENGQKVRTEEVEGWYEEMAFKTLCRAAYDSITIDSQKIDDHYMAVITRERENREARVENDITEQANNSGEPPIGFDDHEEQRSTSSEEPVPAPEFTANFQQPQAQTAAGPAQQAELNLNATKDRGF